MLAIRMQRTGRKGHAMFRVVVQDSRRTPTSGKVVANIGSYDPHAKSAQLDKEKAAFYLEHGAQPSDRVARLLQSEGIKLPSWVSISEAKQRTVRNAEKRRSTAPAQPEAPAEEAAPAEEPTAETTEAPAEQTEEVTEAPQEEAAEATTETPSEPATETAEAPAEEAVSDEA